MSKTGDLSPKDYTDYVKMSVEELKTLASAYREKIMQLRENNIIKKLSTKFKINIERYLRPVMIFLLISWTAITILTMFFMTLKMIKVEEMIYWFGIPSIIFITFLAFIVEALQLSKINYFYEELGKINLILKTKKNLPSNSGLDKKDREILFILKDKIELNLTDLKKFLERKLNTTIDKKELLAKLKKLKYHIVCDEKPYKCKFSGKELAKTKVYRIKD